MLPAPFKPHIGGWKHPRIVPGIVTCCSAILLASEITHKLYFGFVTVHTMRVIEFSLGSLFPNTLLAYWILFFPSTARNIIPIGALPMLLLSWLVGRLLVKGAARWGWGWMVLAYALVSATAFGGVWMLAVVFPCVLNPTLCLRAPGP